MNFFRILDKKEYELKDHLGNVRVAIGDMKLPENEATSTRGVPPFVTDEKAVNDYYPFGMTIAERSYQTGGYRYGYNGKENDNEVKGTGNSVDYGERISDPRAGRFLSQDPLKNKFPSQSPYVNAGNNPITFIDVDGMFPINIVIRSFAPFNFFGPAFLWVGDGEKRKFSCADDKVATSRVRMVTQYETETEVGITTAYGARSESLYGAQGKSEAYLNGGEKTTKTSSLGFVNHLWGKNEAFWPTFGVTGNSIGGRYSPTFDIDLTSRVSVRTKKLDDGRISLNISGLVHGDQFPSAEAFVQDAKGNSVFLGVFATGGGQQMGPVFDLLGTPQKNMIRYDIRIITDKDGVFQSVLKDGKEIGLKEWNQQFENQPTTKKED